MNHQHTLVEVPASDARSIFEERKQISEHFVFFKCRECEEHLYMLKEDFEKRCTYWEDTPSATYAKPAVVDLTNIKEHGVMFFFNKELNEWDLLYTIIS